MKFENTCEFLDLISNKEKIDYLNEGLEENESNEVLSKIFEHQSRLDLTCRYSWTENNIAIWDNRCVIHYAIADFFPGRGLGYERVMDRIAVIGDRPY